MKKTLGLLKDKSTPVVIHKFQSDFLKKKINFLGFDVIELAHGEKFFFDDQSFIQIFSADNCNPELCGRFFGCGNAEGDYLQLNIDTLALFEDANGNRLLNVNDCPYELACDTILSNGLVDNIDVLLVGYAGAGPYPQCFYFSDESERIRAVLAKEKQFIDQAKQFVNLVCPKIFIPFAGTYFLGGKFADRNVSRGVPSIHDAGNRIKQGLQVNSELVVLEQLQKFRFKERLIDSSACVPFGLAQDDYIREIKSLKYDYEYEFIDAEILQNIEKNITKVVLRFQMKAKEMVFDSDTEIILGFGKDWGYKFSTSMGVEKVMLENYFQDQSRQYVRLDLDIRLLDRLLSGPRYAYWNNAEIGSHLTYQHSSAQFERALYYCLCFLYG